MPYPTAAPARGARDHGDAGSDRVHRQEPRQQQPEPEPEPEAEPDRVPGAHPSSVETVFAVASNRVVVNGVVQRGLRTEGSWRMRRRIGLIAVLAITGAVAVGTVAAVAVADEGGSVRERLTGYEEVPALSTPGVGQFRASIDVSDGEISYSPERRGPRVELDTGPHPLRERVEQRPDLPMAVHESRQRAGRHAGVPGRGRNDQRNAQARRRHGWGGGPGYRRRRVRRGGSGDPFGRELRERALRPTAGRRDPRAARVRRGTTTTDG